MDAVSVRLTYPEYKALLELKKSEGQSISWLVSAAVREYLAKKKEKR
jgi:hypothetical protein